MILLISLLAMPLCAQQVPKRPSPFPEKNRVMSSAEPAAERAYSGSSRPARPARPKARTASDSEVPATSGKPSGGTGKATFFSASADGALTASGRRLDAGELVAAHATYPFGSLVKVTNLGNGKTVEVQIVDRFPVSSRIINVSEAAARQLGFIKAGTWWR